MDAFLDTLSADSLRQIRCNPRPALWAAFAAKYNFLWEHTQFDAANRDNVPLEPGFYCFVVGLPGASLPPIGYPLYIGKTERTLRTRFGEYLREKDDEKGRVRVRKFIKVFDGELLFFFTNFHGTPEQVREIETELHDALMPPYSDTGFSADVRARRNAF